jgi:hypothetical protein
MLIRPRIGGTSFTQASEAYSVEHTTLPHCSPVILPQVDSGMSPHCWPRHSAIVLAQAWFLQLLFCRHASVGRLHEEG